MPLTDSLAEISSEAELAEFLTPVPRAVTSG